MERYLSDAAVAFLWSVALGGSFGILYDWFRIGRILFKKGWLAVFMEDLLFSLIAALSTALCFNLTNFGQVRLFLLVGEALGFLIYHYSLGTFVVWQARLFARFFAWIKGKIQRFLTFLGKKIMKFLIFLKKPFIFLKRWVKINLYHFMKENSVGKKERRDSKKKSSSNEPRGAGSFGRCRYLRFRKYAHHRRQAADADSGKKDRAGHRAG